MPTCHGRFSSGRNGSLILDGSFEFCREFLACPLALCERVGSEFWIDSMNNKLIIVCFAILSFGGWTPPILAQSDRSTHETDHFEDEEVEVLETVHVHGLKLNKDQQLGPVPKYTPWPTMPPSLNGKEIDDWMKIRILVTKTAETTVVVLQPAKHRQLNLAGLRALKQWTFDPQMDGDNPIDGELTVRIHFRTK